MQSHARMTVHALGTHAGALITRHAMQACSVIAFQAQYAKTTRPEHCTGICRTYSTTWQKTRLVVPEMCAKYRIAMCLHPNTALGANTSDSAYVDLLGCSMRSSRMTMAIHRCQSDTCTSCDKAIIASIACHCLDAPVMSCTRVWHRRAFYI